MLRRLIPVVLVMACGTVYAAGSGTEVSAVSGFYQSNKTKVDGTNAGGDSTISLAGRFHQFLNEDQQWFAQAGLSLKSWDAPAGSKAPSNATSIYLLGGLRQFFTEFSQVVIPYAALYGGYVNQKDGEVGATPTEEETSGLYYIGALGFRMDVAAETFFEIECTVFQSALFGTTTTKNAAGQKTETSTTDLYVSGSNDNAAGNLSIAIGMEI